MDNISERKIYIFDSTLRDGEQAPGFSMNLKEKLKMAKQLEKLKVDVIEAGFAVVSEGDFNCVKTIAESIKTSSVCSLARCLHSDIDCAYEAIKNAADPLIHVFIATSDIHMKYKLKKTPEEVLEQAVDAVKYAKKYCSNVEFSAEDATRSDPEFLRRIYSEVIKAGATVINVPDTVGYASPKEMFELVSFLKNNLDLSNTLLSVHCHNDLGNATANTMAAISAGADRIEGTINGIGERAGNASIEEIVMNLYTKKNIYNAYSDVDTTLLYPTSKLLTMLTGVKVQPNKAIVGANAFAHESGIHQHGVMANRKTYEIMTPESVGRNKTVNVLGKHSGKHALEEAAAELGFNPDENQINQIFTRFKDLCDKKKKIDVQDVEAIVRSVMARHSEEFSYKLEEYIISSGNISRNTCIVRLSKFDGTEVSGHAIGEGPIDAAYSSINNATGMNITLNSYSIEAVTDGTDAQGAVSVRIEENGVFYRGYGVSMNIFEASILAYVNAINNLQYEKNINNK